MATPPKYTIDFDCNFEDLTFNETTGVYNAVSNLYGYGSPNIEVGDVDSTTLVIENLLTSTIFDTITSITASSTEVPYTFELSDLTVDGAAVYDTALKDGIYEFTYSLLVGSDTYSYTIRKLILPDLNSLLCNAMLEITAGDCACHSGFIDKWLIGFAYLKGLEGSAICGDITAFQNQYDFVFNYLTNLKCNC